MTRPSTPPSEASSPAPPVALAAPEYGARAAAAPAAICPAADQVARSSAEWAPASEAQRPCSEVAR